MIRTRPSELEQNGAKVINRLPLLSPTDLSEDQNDLYATITREWRPPTSEDGTLDGPYNAWLYAPAVGRLFHSFAHGLRDVITLSDRSREFAILTVASHPFSPYAWHAHEGRARALGITEDQIDAIRHTGHPQIDDPIEDTVVAAARVIVVERDLPDDLYARAIEHLGPQGLVELLALCSWYQSLALQFQVFRVPPRAT